MRTNKVFGGHLEIQALAIALELKITVFHNNKPIVINLEGKKEISIKLIKCKKGDGHYMLIK